MEFKLDEAAYARISAILKARDASQISRGNSIDEMESESKSALAPYDENVSEEVLFQNGDWEAVCDRLETLETQGIELNARQLALKSYCLAKMGSPSSWSNYALRSIEKDASQVLPYCAMATGALDKNNLHDASRWLALAHETGLSASESEYARTSLAYNYLEEHLDQMLPIVIECLNSETALSKIKELYPKLGESNLFVAGVEAAKAHPQDFKRLLSSNGALSWFLSRLRSDPAAEILSAVDEDSKKEHHITPIEAAITSLPRAVVTRMASFLSLSTQSKLRQASQLMRSAWGHWELWQAHVTSIYLSTLRTGSRMPRIDIGCYPLAPHEWEPFARTLNYVLTSWHVAKKASEGLEHGISGHSYVFSATDNGELRKLALKHQIWAAGDYEEPFDVLLALINLLCIDKGPLIPTLINAISSTPMLMTHLAFNPRSKVASTSALVSSMLILRKPLLSLDFRKMCFIQATETLSSTGDAGALAARGAIAFADKLGHGFQLIPIWFPATRPSSMLSQPIKLTHENHPISRSASGADTDSFQSASSRRPNDRPVGGIHGKSDCSGVYRLFYRYKNPEIEDEYDRGYIDLKFDSETWRVSGGGFDSLRGRFKLLDGNSRLSKSLRKEELQSHSEQVDQFDDLLSHAVSALSLTMQYEDNTRISLNGSLFPYGYAGTMSFLELKQQGSHGAADPSSCFGHWIMVYDHASSSAQGEDRVEELKYLRDEAFEQFETPDKLRFGFPLIPYGRPVERFFEPWAPEVQSAGYAHGVLRLKNFSMLFQSTHSDSFDARLNRNLGSMEVPPPEQVSMVLRRQTIRAAGDRETKAKYAARCHAWLTLYLEYRCCALDFAIQYAADRFDRAIQRFEFGSPQEVFDEKCFWAQLLCLCTEMTLCEPQALLLLLQDAQKINNMRHSEREAILAAEQQARANADTISDSVSSSDSGFFNALDMINGGETESIEGSEEMRTRSKSKRSAKRLGAVSIAAIVGSVVLVGIGAFVASRVINRRPAKR